MAEFQSQPNATWRVLGPILAIAGCCFLWPALWSFDPGDWPSPHQFPHNVPIVNACGPAGAWVAYELRHYLGDGAYPLALFLTLATLTRLAKGRVGAWGERVFGVGLLVLATAVSVHVISSPGRADLPVGHGGVIGFALGELLMSRVSSLGSFIILASSLLVGVIFATEGWVLKVPALLVGQRDWRKDVTNMARALTGALKPAPAAVPASAGAIGGGRRTAPESALPELRKAAARAVDARRTRDDSAEEAPWNVDTQEPPEASDTGNDDEGDAGSPSARENGEDVATLDVDDEEAPPASDRDDDAPAADIVIKASAPRKPVIVNFARPQKPQQILPYPRLIENWELPGLNLLEDPEYGFTAQQESIVREKARILERTLEEFRIEAQVVEIDTGPVITMFELRLAPGIKVSQIATLSNDIARALKAPAIRVVAPIPGKNTVGIEVPNVEKEKVRLKELMLLAGDKAEKMALPIFIGKDAGGNVLMIDLAKAPHMLIAGTTGSGKSVCLNSIILGLLMTKPPDRVKLILVDPKMVEMSQFKDVPHLMCPIVTDMIRAEKILEWAVTKMDERYELLAEAGVRHIANFNAMTREDIYARLKPATEHEKAQIPTYMPYIVIMIDELADLMMTAAKEVEHHLSRLAQKSRAVGIHIVVATQRPEVKVVTGLIKSNLPCRISFRVASRMDSRIVLDQNGGEVLMGQGDMLFLPPGSHKLLRAQGTFLEDAEVKAVLDDLAGKGKPEFHPELARLRSADEASLSERDPLFDQAVRIILQTKRGSVSLLQRRLTVGYSRASRLMDQMAEAGIVGDYKGSQAREVHMTLAEWDALRKQRNADLEAGFEADEEDFDGASGDAGGDDEARDETGQYSAG